MHECNDRRLSLNRLHFQFVSRQTLSCALRTLRIQNELHGIIFYDILILFGKGLKKLQIIIWTSASLFLYNVFFCYPEKMR